jgi:hypothetical protein
MTPNQTLRLSLLKTVLADGPQPIHEPWLYRMFSDVSMNSWLAEHELKIVSKFKVDYSAFPHRPQKLLTFFVIGKAQETAGSDLAERQLDGREFRALGG